MRKTRLILLAIMFFGFTEAFPCSVVQLDTFVVFNRLEGSLLQYGQVWPKGTIALYSGFDYSEAYKSPPVKQVAPDNAGHFDFGPLLAGKYVVAVFDGKTRIDASPIVVYEDARPLRTWMLIDYRKTTPDCKEMSRWYSTTLIPNKTLMKANER